MNKYRVKVGIELLRYATRLLDNCNETFNQKYSAEELLNIADASAKSDWEIFPDRWNERQIKEALTGIVPQWESDGRTPKFAIKECFLDDCHNPILEGGGLPPSDYCERHQGWRHA